MFEELKAKNALHISPDDCDDDDDDSDDVNCGNNKKERINGKEVREGENAGKDIFQHP